MTKPSKNKLPSQQKKQGIISKMNEWLRINYPFIWRTKLHYFVFFSLIFANIFLWFYSYIYAGEIHNFPTPNSMLDRMFLFQFLIAPFFFYWAYKQTKIPLREQSPKGYLYNWVIYTSCIFSLGINSIIFIHPTILHMADFESEEALQATYDYHEENDFWTDSPSLDSAKFHAHKERISSDLIKYGLMEEGSILSDNNFITYANTDNTIYTPNGTTFNDDFKLKLNSLLEAHNYKNGKDNSHFSYIIAFILFFIGSLFSAGLLVVFSLPRHVLTRHFQFSIPFINNHKSDDERQTISGKFDSFLLTHSPTIWSTNIHNYFIHTLIFFIGMGLLMWILPIDITIFERFIDDITNPTNAHFLTLFILFSISFPLWAYHQITNKNAPTGIYKNVCLLSTYFFIISFIPLFITGIFEYFYKTTLFKGIDGIAIIIFLSSCAAIWVYFSKFMTTKKSLYLGIPFTFMAVSINSILLIIPMFLFFVTPGDNDLSLSYIFINIFYLSFLAILAFFITKTKHIKLLYGFALYYLSAILITIGPLSLIIIAENNTDISENNIFPLLIIYFINLFLLPLLCIPAMSLLSKAKSLPRE